jgi:UDP-3-O-[3-hydroxymyristoyl] glucosamine N-acyltransferase
MRFDKPIPLTKIATMINAELIGNTAASATGINEIHKVEEGDLVFVDHPKYYETCINSAASFIIINKRTDFPEGKALLITADPFEAYQTIVNHFRPFAPSMKMISDSSVAGEGTVIMPNP